MTTNGQLRLGQGSIGKNSLSKDKLDIGKDSINNKVITTGGIMTEQQLLQAVYLERIKDRNANNIIECVSYLKYLPIEMIKVALEKTSMQLNPEWNYTKELLDNWIKKGITNISEIEKNYSLESVEENKSSNDTNMNINIIEKGGFKRKGDEILDGPD